MPCLFIARLPAASSVEAFEAELVPARGSRAPFLQALKSKCRELARSESSLLVSPTHAALHTSFGTLPPMSLWILAKIGCIGNPTLQEKLKQLGIKVVSRVSVSGGVLQTCYQFSLTARLAPKWNYLTSWLVQGTEFLSTGRAHAVVLQVGVTKTELTLSVDVSKLNFNFLRPSDLGVSTATLNAFTSDPLSVIRENSIYHNRCMLIPNLTVGYVFSASHQLPHSPEFPTYDRLRVHWKKQHGMILPEKQSMFFQVFFKSNSRNFFSYPSCCVLKCPPTVSSSRDTSAVASSFIADVHARMPSLCGEPIRYSSKALTPFTHLQPATRTSAYPNVRPVSNARPTSMPRPRPLSGVHSYIGAQSVTRAETSGTGSNLIQRAAATAAALSGRSATQYPQQLQTVPEVGGGSTATVPQSQCQSSGAKIGWSRPPATSTIPSSQPLPPRTATTNGSSRTGAQANARVVPVFKPSFSATSRQPSSQPPKPRVTKSVPIVPSFRPQTVSTARQHTAQTVPSTPSKPASAPAQRSGTLTQQSQKRTLTASCPPAKRPRLHGQQLTTQTNSRQQSNPTTPHVITDNTATLCTASTAGGDGIVRTPGSGGSHTQHQTMAVAGSQRMVPDLSRLPSAASLSSMDSSFTLHSTVTSAVQSKPTSAAGASTGRGGGTGPPQVTQKKGKGSKKMAILIEGVSEDIVSKISKVKVPVLRKWLQENGVRGTSKKSKEDMVRMAALHLRDTGKTFSVPA